MSAQRRCAIWAPCLPRAPPRRAARVEIGRDELARALDAEVSERIVRELLALGYQEVTIDPRGYRMGSLNEGIHVRLVVGG
jgi:PP-loop superfamily ATP-utilizing enzyme